ncbi:hypothetical protein JTB14_002596 [Gonioctena quinquepunctata]|nr:hypothetical protein JTB14_002596 [Gonioctena quinquepunctata]
MQLLILTLIATSQVAHCSPLGVTVGLDPQHHPIQSLYHSQDKNGQYAYGYATPTSTRNEATSADGVTRGGYSYIDSNGYLQTVEYVADPVHGFRVAATNLPRDLPDVAFARARHLAEYDAIRTANAQIAAARAIPYSNPVAVPAGSVPQIALDHQVPQPVTDLPEVVQARNQHLAILHAAYNNVPVALQPVQDTPEVARARAEHLAIVAETRKYQAALNAHVNLGAVPEDVSGGVVPLRTVPTNVAYGVPNQRVAQEAQVSYTPAGYGQEAAQDGHQDVLRPYSYGYVGPLSGHSESRAADGVTRGGYSYLDANGIVQTVQYVADENGFRVAASNIPVDVNHIQGGAVTAPQQQVEEKVVVNSVPAQLYTHEIVY